MIDRSHLLARLMRRSRAEHPPDDEAARFDFDALARDLAAGLSRREAIRRLGVGLGGALLAALGLAPAAEAVTCPPPQIDCFGVCRNPQTDPKHCGRCGAACNVGHLCCNGVCKNPSNDKANCGGCGIVCAANQYCCSGRCVNPQTDPNHCGACLQVCPPGASCINGACLCPAGQVLCYGRCTDRSTDENNCGGCGVRCAATQVCQNGQCRACPPANLCNGSKGRTCCTSTQPTCCDGVCCVAGRFCCNKQCGVCPCDKQLCEGSQGTNCCGAGETCCDGACVNTQTDPMHCGNCATVCDTGACSNGRCACNTSVGGTPCPPGQVCVSGFCHPCTPTSAQCVCNASNPCPTDAGGAHLVCSGAGGSSPGRCEGCNTTNLRCPAGEVCDGGFCRPCTPTSVGCVCDASHPCPTDASGAHLICSGGITPFCVSCGLNFTCPAGEVCDGGFCRPCTMPDELCVCDDSHPCPTDASGSHRVCAPFSRICVGCGATVSCPAGEVCVSGLCRPCTPTSVGCVCDASHPCPADASGGHLVCAPFSRICVGCGGGSTALCPAGEVCDNGLCRPCPPGLTACPDGCWDTQNDPNHCGGCDNICVVGTCMNGVCG